MAITIPSTYSVYILENETPVYLVRFLYYVVCKIIIVLELEEELLSNQYYRHLSLHCHKWAEEQHIEPNQTKPTKNNIENLQLFAYQIFSEVLVVEKEPIDEL